MPDQTIQSLRSDPLGATRHDGRDQRGMQEATINSRSALDKGYTAGAQLYL
jgi:hypothetical protein